MKTNSLLDTERKYNWRDTITIIFKTGWESPATHMHGLVGEARRHFLAFCGFFYFFLKMCFLNVGNCLTSKMSEPKVEPFHVEPSQSAIWFWTWPSCVWCLQTMHEEALDFLLCTKDARRRCRRVVEKDLWPMKILGTMQHAQVMFSQSLGLMAGDFP